MEETGRLSKADQQALSLTIAYTLCRMWMGAQWTDHHDEAYSVAMNAIIWSETGPAVAAVSALD